MVCVKRLMFLNSREASSLLEAGIGIAVHEIMGIMNKVKYRPQGQYYSQWAAEKETKKKTSVQCSALLDITRFPADRRELSAKNISSLDQCLSLWKPQMSVCRVSSQGHCQWLPLAHVLPSTHTKSAFSRVRNQEKRERSCLLMPWHKPSCVLNILASMELFCECMRLFDV